MKILLVFVFAALAASCNDPVAPSTAPAVPAPYPLEQYHPVPAPKMPRIVHDLQ